MSKAAIRGVIDGVHENTVYGWARHTGSTRRVRIEIIHGDRLVDSIPADQYRQDLETAGEGDGHCAFAWVIPEKYRDGDSYSFLVQTEEGSPVGELQLPTLESDPSAKFVGKMPAAQNAIDIFAGEWLTRIPNPVGGFFASGDLALFTDDARPHWTAGMFGDPLCGLKNRKILELGPMEGHHTYQLERMGGDVIAIECNAECYLKCLVVKEALGMRAKFFLGNFLSYLEAPGTFFDLIMASGVLYHMVNPIRLIYLLSTRTNNVFMWTHYWKEGIPDEDWPSERIGYGGYECTGYRRHYGSGENLSSKYMGGLGAWAVRLPPENILEAFHHFGLSEVIIHDDYEQHEGGPCMSFSASVPRRIKR